jgi:Tfp pilus assembly protein PilO
MSQSTSSSGMRRLLLKQLSHPLKLRLVLCAAIIVAWHALFLSPLSEQAAATTARISRERKRETTAHEIEQLKKALVPHSDLLGSGDGEHELIGHVVARIRSSPLRLVDLKPEKPKNLGPFVAIGLRLSLVGTYNDIDEFLAWAEHGQRLLRVDTIRLTPMAREPGRLSINLTLMALSEKNAAPKSKDQSKKPAAKDKAESKKPATKGKAESRNPR